MLRGNINGKQLIRYYLLSSIITGLLSLINYIILGTFYIAINHTILVNIIVWTTTVIISFSIYYFIYYLIVRKKKKFGPILNGYAIASGCLSILLACLAMSYTLNDYLYVEVMGYLTGISALPQIIIDTINHIKK